VIEIRIYPIGGQISSPESLGSPADFKFGLPMLAPDVHAVQHPYAGMLLEGRRMSPLLCMAPTASMILRALILNHRLYFHLGHSEDLMHKRKGRPLLLGLVTATESLAARYSKNLCGHN
jgi:hypothetical protein